MSRFIQLHVLSFYPPSNLNRDDTGRPKTAVMGGVERLRVSSQALKRAIRTSDIFARGVGQALEIEIPNFGEAQGRSLGVRSKRIVTLMIDEVLKLRPDWEADRDAVAAKVKAAIAKAKGKDEEDDEDDADENETPKTRKSKKNKSANELVIGSLDKKRPLDTNEVVHLGPEEVDNVKKIAKTIAEGITVDPKQVALLVERPKAVDIAFFGRMLAGNPNFNVEAAVQLAHAITTHRVAVEDDFYTAVDDLKTRDEDAGAGFMGELGFGSGVFYIYICVDTDLLVKNLGGDEALAKAALSAFTEALAKVSPTGKQASFASRSCASYILAERGAQQPRTLASAFVRPVRGDDLISASIGDLETTRDAMDKAYGGCAEARDVMNVHAGIGSLSAIQAFVTQW
jgi:CRISPR system Cascade subunit CasC